MRHFSALLAAALLTAGCVSMGPDYDPAAIASFQPGVDKSAVIARLGRPSSTVMLPDGRQQLMWIHSRGTMLGRGEARSVMLMFDAQGKYTAFGSQPKATSGERAPSAQAPSGAVPEGRAVVTGILLEAELLLVATRHHRPQTSGFGEATAWWPRRWSVSGCAILRRSRSAMSWSNPVRPAQPQSCADGSTPAHGSAE